MSKLQMAIAANNIVITTMFFSSSSFCIFIRPAFNINSTYVAVPHTTIDIHAAFLYTHACQNRNLFMVTIVLYMRDDATAAAAVYCTCTLKWSIIIIYISKLYIVVFFVYTLTLKKWFLVTDDYFNHSNTAYFDI